MGVPLAEDPADPDVCGHLRPGTGAAGADGLAAGLTGLDEVAAEDVCDVRAAGAAEEALAMLTPNARVAPSTAAPAAVPISGLVILTRFSFPYALPDSPARAG